MKELEYPFDSEYILKKSKSIKKQLLAEDISRIDTKIAVLGGSTTHDIIRILELFLLNYGICPTFYESEYGMYWQDAMFPSEELIAFKPDVIFIHTSNRNINHYPELTDTAEIVENKLSDEYNHFVKMWDKLSIDYHCPIIQNNFEYPFYRLMGNKDTSDIHGKVSFINRLNECFCEYARTHENFYIYDINYQAAIYGLDKWADPFFWHMYKYCMCVPAIPAFAYSLSNIIKSLYGKNKKSLVLDLDNTLWGGIVGDDGPENIEIGQETSMSQVYSEFQSYIKAQKDLGIMLNIDSKNDRENALAGLNRPDGSLKPDDFIVIKANWEPKSQNLVAIAKELNIMPDSMVFVDDNPAEQEIVRSQVPGVAVPVIGNPEQYIRVLDHSGFFEVTNLSDDDRKRNEMYQANANRKQLEERFGDYTDYLKSLEMKATIRAFEPMYMARIAQLTNKSNQFNLTTRRFTQAEIEQMAADEQYITLCGKLEDKFGDNGVVSVVIGKKENDTLHIVLWLMSCRVLKRDMEVAMFDELVKQCMDNNITTIMGYYYKTAKNSMVKDFYKDRGFEQTSISEDGDSIWKFDINNYKIRNQVIKVNEI